MFLRRGSPQNVFLRRGSPQNVFLRRGSPDCPEEVGGVFSIFSNRFQGVLGSNSL